MEYPALKYQPEIPTLKLIYKREERDLEKPIPEIFGYYTKKREQADVGINLYSFGMPMPGRSFNSEEYRYGFNGQEKDDEVKGEGNSLDFGARIHDPRLGRFLSVDPDFSMYAWQSPYAFAGNSPIRLIDIDGRGPGDNDNPNNDLLITVAWPDKVVSLTAGTKWVERTGFMGADEGKIKAGHAGIILVNRDDGNIYYYDFGRYGTSKGKGRVRDSGSDGDLRLNLKAKFDDDGNITNINDILIAISEKKTFDSYGRMTASITKGVNFEAAREFAENLQAEGEVDYGPFEFGGSNCARFVQDCIDASDPPLAVDLDVNTNITPSPQGNVENADTEEQVYTVENGNVSSKKTGIVNKVKSWFSDDDGN